MQVAYTVRRTVTLAWGEKRVVCVTCTLQVHMATNTYDFELDQLGENLYTYVVSEW